MLALKKVRMVALLALTGMIGLGAKSAQAVDRHWNNPAGGNWNVATNWTPNGVPATGDNAFIDAAGTYTVRFINQATGTTLLNSLSVGGAAGTQTLFVPQNNLSIDVPSVVAASGVLNLANGGTIKGAGKLTIDGTFQWTGGQLQGGTGTSIDIDAGATMNTVSGIGVTLARNLNNAGTLTWSSTGNIALAAGVHFDNQAGGTFLIQNDHDLTGPGSGGVPTVTNEGTIVKSGSSGTTTVNSTVSFANAGGLVDLQSGTFKTIGNYNQTSGTTKLNGGTLAATSVTGVNLTGGSLIGNGTVTGNVTNGASVSPGLAPATVGSITVSGKYTQTGALNIEIGGTAPANYDQLHITGAAALGGTLNITFINGFTLDNSCNPPNPAVDTFQIITYGSHTGTFATVTGDPDGAGPIFFTVNYNPTDATLVIDTTGPVISSFAPTAGGPGTVVTLTGRNFTGTTAVQFNGAAANSFTVNSNTSLTATAPLSVTTGPITVTNGSGTGSTCGNFTVDTVAPTVQILSPTDGSSIANFNGGIVVGTSEAETSVTSVTVTLRRARDSKFWNSTTMTWSSDAAMIPAVFVGSSGSSALWFVPAASLPPAGADTGIYNIWGFAFDQGGNMGVSPRVNVAVTGGVAASVVQVAPKGDTPSE